MLKKAWAESRVLGAQVTPGAPHTHRCPRSNAWCCPWHPGTGHCPAWHYSTVARAGFPASTAHPLLPASVYAPSPSVPSRHRVLCQGGAISPALWPLCELLGRDVLNPSTHPARADPCPKSLPGSAGFTDTASSAGLSDLTMRLLASLTLCLWAGLSTAVIPGGDKDGDGCPAGCSGCPGKQGVNLAGHKEGLGRGAGAAQPSKD